MVSNPIGPLILSSPYPLLSPGLNDDSLLFPWDKLVGTMCVSSLALGSAASLLVIILKWYRTRYHCGDGAIRLPDELDPCPSTRKQVLADTLLGNIDNTLVSDGEAVDVAAFWARARVFKLVTAGICVFTTAFQIYWSLKTQTLSTSTLAMTPMPAWRQVLVCLHVLVNTQLIILVTVNFFTSSYTLHNRLTVHGCTLGSVLVVSNYFSVYGEHLWFTYSDRTPIPPPIAWGSYVLLTGSVAQLVMLTLVPLGPDLYHDLAPLYSRAVRQNLLGDQVPEEYADVEEQRESISPRSNVAPRLSASILSCLLFGFVWPVVLRAAKVEQLDVMDLPAVSARVRTQVVLHSVVNPKFDMGNRKRYPILWLIWTTWGPQWPYLLQTLVYMFSLVPLWYIPHFCLQQIFWVLDNAPGNKTTPIAYSILLLLGRFGGLIVLCQQMNLTSLLMRPRIQAHTSYLLYQKLLTRNTFASPEDTSSSTSSATGDDNKSKSKLVHTRADILNLISSDSQNLRRLGIDILELFRSALEMLLGCTYVWYLLGSSGMWGLATLLVTCPPAYYITKWQYKVYEKRLAVSDEKVSLMQEAVQAITMIKMMASEMFWYRRIKQVRDREFSLLVVARLLGVVSGLLYSLAPNLVVVVAFAHYTLVAKKELTATIAFTSIAVFEELRPVLMGLPMNLAELLQEILSVKRISLFLQAEDLDYLSEPAAHAQAHAHGPVAAGAPLVDIDEGGPLIVRGTVAWDIETSSRSSTIPSDTTSSTDTLRDTRPVPKGFALRDVDAWFPRGVLTLVAGKFGSGKSLMLLALLGEARLVSGHITYAVSPVMAPEPSAEDDGWSLIPGGVAYVPQTAWLQSMSIRENILFGLPLNSERYKAVIFACGLMPDLQVLEDSDLTEIGERGKILSGGQKARVSLARAMYSRASTLLLDDVISAVDAQTSQHIITHCFQSSLFMAGRTVVIASHAVEAVGPLAAHALFLDDGKLLWSGSGKDLLKSEHMHHLKTPTVLGGSTALEHAASVGSQSLPRAHTGLEGNDELASIAVEDAFADAAEYAGSSSFGTDQFKIEEMVNKTPRQLIMDEVRVKGYVDSKHWWMLKRANGSNVFWIGLVVLLLFSCFMPIVERKVLSQWTGAETETRPPSTHSTASPYSDTVFWIAMYSSVTLGTVVMDSIFSFYRFWGGLRATKRVHARMLEHMLRAKMTFFTQTRAGSIIQRFGTDLRDVQECSELLGEIVTASLNVVVSLLSVTYYGGWIFAVVAILLIVAIWQPGKLYRSASRQARRLSAIIPGPINAIYGETVAGTAVIRAFGTQSIFLRELTGHLNMQILSYQWQLQVGSWLLVNLRLMDIAVVATALALLLSQRGLSGATAGFVLAFAGSITSNINWVLNNLRQFELKGISLERTQEYTTLAMEDGIKLNADIDDDHDDDDDNEVEVAAMPPPEWPSNGTLNVSNLCASYGPGMPEILHDVTFTIEGGQRVGIVGATGGGKSTLAKAFFSFVEITKGKIEIDGIDLKSIPLGHVRSKLGIIAQDPVLLSGSLRLNLDIDGQYKDEQLYNVLHQVQLLKHSEIVECARTPTSIASSVTAINIDIESESGQAVSRDGANDNIFTNLDSEIKSGGDNLSAGQKQLVVLARALLKKQKILILDEATASIDSRTDGEISRLVHEDFTGVTVLIIAHRLRTIMPCGKILVLDKGKVIQEGSPSELINVDGGKFQSLCLAAGMDEYEHLRTLAAARQDMLQH